MAQAKELPVKQYYLCDACLAEEAPLNALRLNSEPGDVDDYQTFSLCDMCVELLRQRIEDGDL